MNVIFEKKYYLVYPISLVLLGLLILFFSLSGLDSGLVITQVLATVLIGFVGLVYTNRQSEIMSAQSEASLLFEVSPSNVVIAKNSGTIPLDIISIASTTHTIKRSWATHEVLLKIFNDLHRGWKDKGDQGLSAVPIKVQAGMRLSKDETVTILHPQRGLNAPIETYECVVQIISVIYRTSLNDVEYRKSVGVYRLTSPEEYLLWKVCNEDKPAGINFNQLVAFIEARGLKCNTGSEYVETLRQNILNTNLVPSNYLSILSQRLSDYDQQQKMNTDSLPQDEWRVYRIKTDRVNHNHTGHGNG